MVVKGEASKGKIWNKNSEGVVKHTEDRLSSLPNDILFGILTRLPLKSAVVTGTLSHRWYGLWTNVTSIDIGCNDTRCYTPKILNTIDDILKKITSPFIQTFSVIFVKELDEKLPWEVPLDACLSQVCKRNVRELKVTCHGCFCGNIFRLSGYIFQTTSLVSLELKTTFGWQLPNDGNPINLPNLKNLTVDLSCLEWEWIEKLIKACPSLEDLSLLRGLGYQLEDRHMNCSNQNIRRLVIEIQYYKNENVEINAPKLEYLEVHVSKYSTICFAEEPIGLREAKINFTGIYRPPSEHENRSRTRIYQVICNVRILTLDISIKYNMPSIVFPNATQLTLNMKESHNIKNVLTVVELCPVLDVLTLQFHEIDREDKDLIPKSGDVRALQRVLKRIEIEASWLYYHHLAKSFLEIAEYFLSTSKDLEHFHFSVVGIDYSRPSLEQKQDMELSLCKLLYRCPMISTECEVEFKGKFLKMSRKAGPKAWKTNGEAIPLDQLT